MGFVVTAASVSGCLRSFAPWGASLLRRCSTVRPSPFELAVGLAFAARPPWTLQLPGVPVAVVLRGSCSLGASPGRLEPGGFATRVLHLTFEDASHRVRPMSSRRSLRLPRGAVSTSARHEHSLLGFSKFVPPSTHAPGVHSHRSSPASWEGGLRPRHAMSSTCSVLVVSHDLDGLLLLGAASLADPQPTMGFITFQAGSCAVPSWPSLLVSKGLLPGVPGTTHPHRSLDTLVAFASRQATRGHDLSSHLLAASSPEGSVLACWRVSSLRAHRLSPARRAVSRGSRPVRRFLRVASRVVLTCFDTESPTQTSSTAWLRPRGCTTSKNWGSESGASVESACPAPQVRVRAPLQLPVARQLVPVPPVLSASLLEAVPGFPWCSADPVLTEVRWCRSRAGGTRSAGAAPAVSRACFTLDASPSWLAVLATRP